MDKKIQPLQVVSALLKELRAHKNDSVGDGVTNTVPETVKLANDFIKQELTPDQDLLSKAATVVSNACGFPCEVLVYQGHGFRIAPELDTVQGNFTVYLFLKKFNEFYEEAHQAISGGRDVMVFTDLISAIFDFCGYWEPYKGMNLREAIEVLQTCAQVRRNVAIELLSKENKKGL